MSEQSNQEERYNKLKIQLEENVKFPAKYPYKFILLTEHTETQKVLLSRFDNMGAVVQTKLSKNGKYTSITILAEMASADAIIDQYKSLEDIEGLMSL